MVDFYLSIASSFYIKKNFFLGGKWTGGFMQAECLVEGTTLCSLGPSSLVGMLQAEACFHVLRLLFILFYFILMGVRTALCIEHSLSALALLCMGKDHAASFP